MKNKKEYNGDNSQRREKLMSRNTIEKIVNGEKVETEDEKFFMGKHIEPKFVKLYLDDIDLIYGVGRSSIEVLFELLHHMNYEGLITINTLVKKEICFKLKIKNQGSIANHLTKLVDQDILKRITRGVYMLNPYFAAKGDWRSNVRKIRNLYKNT